MSEYFRVTAPDRPRDPDNPHETWYCDFDLAGGGKRHALAPGESKLMPEEIALHFQSRNPESVVEPYHGPVELGPAGAGVTAFQCPFCDAAFSQFAEMRAHALEQHTAPDAPDPAGNPEPADTDTAARTRRR